MEEIINNVMQSPENTNPNVLRSQLQNIGGGSGGDIPEDVARLKHLAPPYDSTKTYMPGDYVTYSEDALQTSSVYRCNQDWSVTGDWNANYWTPVSVMDEIAHKWPLDDPIEGTTAQMIVRYGNQSSWQEAPARSRMISAGDLNSTFIHILFDVLMPLAKTNGSACQYITTPKSAADGLISACINNMMDDGLGIRAYPCFVLLYGNELILFTLKSGVLNHVNNQNATLTFEANYVELNLDNSTIDIYKIESNLKRISASETALVAISVDYSSATALN